MLGLANVVCNIENLFRLSRCHQKRTASRQVQRWIKSKFLGNNNRDGVAFFKKQADETDREMLEGCWRGLLQSAIDTRENDRCREKEDPSGETRGGNYVSTPCRASCVSPHPAYKIDTFVWTLRGMHILERRDMTRENGWAWREMPTRI